MPTPTTRIHVYSVTEDAATIWDGDWTDALVSVRCKMTAQFNAEQWEAICEWAEVEHADPEELMEDLIRQLLLSWRREHDARRNE